MDIMNIFYRSLGVTSHAKTLLTVCRFRTNLVSILTARGIRSKKIVIHLNDLGYPFEKSCITRWPVSLYQNYHILVSIRKLAKRCHCTRAEQECCIMAD